MAWRSSGSTNVEMVDKLKRFGIISSDSLANGFRNVDRRLFVPKGNEELAYSDQPLKEGHVHISAPHIYGSSLDALELEEDSSLSFLNIGSGTGYLSCIVAEILGPKSLNIGIEIQEDVIEHCKRAIRKWEAERDERDTQCSQVQILHGNALHISPNQGESIVGFDRIYVGASIDKEHLHKITKLLSQGGIMVGPVEDELVKVIRTGPLPSNNSTTSTPDNEFTQQVLSGVRFASLRGLPIIETVIPARVWNPEIQPYFPDPFQRATMQIFMCSNAEREQPRIKTKVDVNMAALLPRVLWIEILSFTHRKWFDSKEFQTDFLKRRLHEEQASALKAHQARLEAEARCQAAERERDIYRLLARRWQSHLHILLRQQRRQAASDVSTSQEEDEGGAEGMSIERLYNLEERAAIFGLGSMLHQHSREEAHGFFFEALENSMEENDEENSYDNVAVMNDNDQLVNFQDLHSDESSDEEEYEFQSIHGDEPSEFASAAAAAQINQLDDDSVIMDDGAEDTGKLLALREQQIRTVSMGSDEL